MNIQRILLWLAMTAALAACAYANINGHVQFYDGDPRPETDVALVKGETEPMGEGTSRVRLVAINGRELSGDAGASLPGAESASLLPGIYTVKVLYLPASPRLAQVPGTLTLRLRASCEYQIVASWNRQRQGYIFDALPSQHGPVNAKTCAEGLWPAPAH